MHMSTAIESHSVALLPPPSFLFVLADDEVVDGELLSACF